MTDQDMMALLQVRMGLLQLMLAVATRILHSLDHRPGNSSDLEEARGGLTALSLQMQALRPSAPGDELDRHFFEVAKRARSGADSEDAALDGSAGRLAEALDAARTYWQTH